MSAARDRSVESTLIWYFTFVAFVSFCSCSELVGLSPLAGEAFP
jgi:hypothetical protein